MNVKITLDPHLAMPLSMQLAAALKNEIMRGMGNRLNGVFKQGNQPLDLLNLIISLSSMESDPMDAPKLCHTQSARKLPPHFAKCGGRGWMGEPFCPYLATLNPPPKLPPDFAKCGGSGWRG